MTIENKPIRVGQWATWLGGEDKFEGVVSCVHCLEDEDDDHGDWACVGSHGRGPLGIDLKRDGTLSNPACWCIVDLPDSKNPKVGDRFEVNFPSRESPDPVTVARVLTTTLSVRRDDDETDWAWFRDSFARDAKPLPPLATKPAEKAKPAKRCGEEYVGRIFEYRDKTEGDIFLVKGYRNDETFICHYENKKYDWTFNIEAFLRQLKKGRLIEVKSTEKRSATKHRGEEYIGKTFRYRDGNIFLVKGYKLETSFNCRFVHEIGLHDDYDWGYDIDDFILDLNEECLVEVKSTPAANDIQQSSMKPVRKDWKGVPIGERMPEPPKRTMCGVCGGWSRSHKISHKLWCSRSLETILPPRGAIMCGYVPKK